MRMMPPNAWVERPRIEQQNNADAQVRNECKRNFLSSDEPGGGHRMLSDG
jgi:hypothetical protein